MREYIVKFDTDEPPSEFPYGTNVRALMKITGDCDEVIRCKDCKHRPKLDEEDVENDTVDGFSFEFPDFKCPCHCEDPYYNWMPKDDWYCGNGERKEEWE